MKIDVVIANPPYNVKSNHICEKIDNDKKKTKNKPKEKDS